MSVIERPCDSKLRRRFDLLQSPASEYGEFFTPIRSIHGKEKSHQATLLECRAILVCGHNQWRSYPDSNGVWQQRNMYVVREIDAAYSDFQDETYNLSVMGTDFNLPSPSFEDFERQLQLLTQRRTPNVGDLQSRSRSYLFWFFWEFFNRPPLHTELLQKHLSILIDKVEDPLRFKTERLLCRLAQFEPFDWENKA